MIASKSSQEFCGSLGGAGYRGLDLGDSNGIVAADLVEYEDSDGDLAGPLEPTISDNKVNVPTMATAITNAEVLLGFSDALRLL